MTAAIQWLAVFIGASEEQINDLSAEFNTHLNDEGPAYTLSDCVQLLREAALPRLIIIAMIRCLLPAKIIDDEITNEDLLDMIRREEFGAIFGPDDVDNETNDENDIFANAV